MAHELAYYLIDYLGNTEYSDNPGRLFSMTYPKLNHESSMEERADRFAAELLLPVRPFLEQFFYAMDAKDRLKDRFFKMI